MIESSISKSILWRGPIAAGRVVLTLILLFCLHPAIARSQVIYDLSEMTSDVQIIGHSESDLILKIAVFDFNANGQDDLFIGGHDSGRRGHVYGIFDQPLYHGLEIDLLKDQIDLEIYGDFPIAVGDDIVCCDINADGIGDLVVSDSNGEEATVYVFFGSDQWVPGTEINLANESADVTISGAWDLGCDMTSADLNGDGYDDLVIGADITSNPIGWSTGAVFAFFAGSQYVSPMNIDLAVDPADLTVYGYSYQDYFGHSLTTGDVNDDGVQDLIVGANQAVYATDKLGRTYVFFGSTKWPDHHVIDLSSRNADVTLIGPQWYSSLGMSVASGDINGDGIDDILTGANSYDGSYESMGVGYAVHGRVSFPPGAEFDLGSEPADLTCTGEVHDSFFGSSMGAGDLDGDGLAEWVISAYTITSGDSSNGKGYIIAGSPLLPPQQTIDFSTDQPTMTVLRQAEDYDITVSNSELSDVNGDGIDDLILASIRADMPGRDNCGKIYIFFGHSPLDDPPRILAGPGPHAANRAEMRLYDPYDHGWWLLRLTPFLVRGYGTRVTAAELDGDGYDEIVIGPGPGPHHPPLVRIFDGEGHPQNQFLAYGTPRYGVNLAAGDLDGDGRDEIVTGAGPGEVYGPHVRAWRLNGGSMAPLPGVSFMAYGTNKYGVNVACGDIDGDGIDEIVTGPGPGEMFGAHVRGWNYDGEALEPISGVSFLAYIGSQGRGGVVVACGDIDNDGNDEILSTPGPMVTNPPWLRTWNYDGQTISLNGNKSFMVFGEGLYVAGANVALGNFYEPPDYLP